MRRSNSHGCSIWQAWPAPGRTFSSQFGIALLQREGALMRAVLAAGEDRRGAGDRLEISGGLGLLHRPELMEDGVEVGAARCAR